jgi:hypothetical protein
MVTATPGLYSGIDRLPEATVAAPVDLNKLVRWLVDEIRAISIASVDLEQKCSNTWQSLRS